jgi:CheY-like chemotaxis protein
MSVPISVAVINTTPDVVEMLRQALERAGFVVATCFTFDIREGRVDLEAFMRQHRPGVILYDLAPPYETNFRLFEHIRSMPAHEDAQFVLTSMNPKNVRHLVGRDEHVYEVVDRDEDLLAIVQAVKEASRVRLLP